MGGLGINFSKLGVSVRITVGEWGEGVWENADRGENGGRGVNSSRFRLRVGRE